MDGYYTAADGFLRRKCDGTCDTCPDFCFAGRPVEYFDGEEPYDDEEEDYPEMRDGHPQDIEASRPVKTYETAPVHPDFAPPWHALTGYPLPWEWVAVLENPGNNIIAMAVSPAHALEIITALQAQEAARASSNDSDTEPTEAEALRDAGVLDAFDING